MPCFGCRVGTWPAGAGQAGLEIQPYGQQGFLRSRFGPVANTRACSCVCVAEKFILEKFTALVSALRCVGAAGAVGTHAALCRTALLEHSRKLQLFSKFLENCSRGTAHTSTRARARDVAVSLTGVGVRAREQNQTLVKFPTNTQPQVFRSLLNGSIQAGLPSQPILSPPPLGYWWCS